jgi:hypothetical protein
MHGHSLHRLARVGRALALAAAGVAVFRHAFTLDWQNDGAAIETLMGGVTGFALIVLALATLGHDDRSDDCVDATVPSPLNRQVRPRADRPAGAATFGFARYRDVTRPMRQPHYARR